MFLTIPAGIASAVLFVAGALTGIDEEVVDFGTASTGLLVVDVTTLRDQGGELRRYQVTVNVGPGAGLSEIGQILTDLGTVAAASAVWAGVERDLAAAAGGDQPDEGDTVTLVRPVVSVGGEPITVESISYRNPIDVILAASGGALATLSALIGVFKHWSIDRAKTTAETGKLTAEKANLDAATRKLNAEAEHEEQKNRIYKAALSWVEANPGVVRASPEMIVAILTESPDVLEVFGRLAMYNMTATELTAAASNQQAST